MQKEMFPIIWVKNKINYILHILNILYEISLQNFRREYLFISKPILANLPNYNG